MSTANRKTSPTALTPEEEAQYAAERAELYAEMAKNPRPPAPPIKRWTDENGRMLPLPENYLEIQAENTRKMFEEWDQMPDDDPPGAYEAARRGIDEERQRLGMRTLFEEHYD